MSGMHGGSTIGGRIGRAPGALLLATLERAGRVRGQLRRTQAHPVAGGQIPGEATRVNAGRMVRTSLQIGADEHAAELRRALAQDLRRMRDDAGCTQAAIAALAGVDPSLITRLETRDIRPPRSRPTRASRRPLAPASRRGCTPTAGPSVRDRHQVRATECLLGVRSTRAGARHPKRPSAARSAAGWMSPFTTRRQRWWWRPRSSCSSAGSSSCSAGARRRPRRCRPRLPGLRGQRRAGRRSPGS